MTLDKIFQKLKENLYKPFIFYIPKNIVPEDNQYLIAKNENFQRIFDNIILIKQDGAGYEIKYHSPLFELIQKESILEDNIFMLFSEKAKQEVEQFDYLLKKYTQELTNFIWISDWLFKNLKKAFNSVNVEDEVLTSFELQQKYLLNHLQVFNKQFYSAKRKTIKQESKPDDIKLFLENRFKELSDHLIAEVGTSDGDQLLEQIKQNEQVKPKKVKLSLKQRRAKILIDIEAEEFLLTSVFNKKDLNKN